MKAFRETLQLTQRDMAGLLGVSQAVITLYEKNNRNLPEAANRRLLLLTQAWLKNRKRKEPPPAAVLKTIQRQEEETTLQSINQAAALSFKIKRLNLQLAAMQGRYRCIVEKIPAGTKLAGAGSWKGATALPGGDESFISSRP